VLRVRVQGEKGFRVDGEVYDEEKGVLTEVGGLYKITAA
jgi:hypothetical protein